MRRVLEIIKKYPEARPVKNLKNPIFDEQSRLNNAINLAEGSERWLDPYPGTFMNYVRHKVPNRKMFKDMANYYRLNPEKMKVMNEWHQEMGSKGQWSQGFMDSMIKNDITEMAKTNFTLRQLTDQEKYLLAVAKQRRQKKKPLRSTPAGRALINLLTKGELPKGDIPVSPFMDDIKKGLETIQGPTDHEKYLLALLRQKRQEANKGAKILPFRRPE